jgi:hypothetical protein
MPIETVGIRTWRSAFVPLRDHANWPLTLREAIRQSAKSVLAVQGPFPPIIGDVRMYSRRLSVQLE